MSHLVGIPKDMFSQVMAQGRLSLCCPLTGMTLSELCQEKTCLWSF